MFRVEIGGRAEKAAQPARLHITTAQRLSSLLLLVAPAPPPRPETVRQLLFGANFGPTEAEERDRPCRATPLMNSGPDLAE